jgi:hypothetical protein
MDVNALARHLRSCRSTVVPALVGLALALGGCAAIHPAGEGARPLTWVRYASGDDLRAGCAPGSPARVRMIHTIAGADRIRTFDLRETPEGAVVETRSILLVDLARLPVDSPVDSPLRNDGPEALLTQAQFSALVATLKAAGLSTRPSTVSTRNAGSFWLVNGCHGGDWFIGVVKAENRYDSARLDAWR